MIVGVNMKSKQAVILSFVIKLWLTITVYGSSEEETDDLLDINGDDQDYVEVPSDIRLSSARRFKRRALDDDCFRAGEIRGELIGQREVRFRGLDECQFGGLRRNSVDVHQKKLHTKLQICMSRPNTLKKLTTVISLYLKIVSACMVIEQYCDNKETKLGTSGYYGESHAATNAKGAFMKQINEYRGTCGEFTATVYLTKYEHALLKWIILVDAASSVNVTVTQLDTMDTYGCEGSKLVIYDIGNEEYEVKLGAIACGKVAPFSVMSRSNKAGIVFRTVLGRSSSEMFSIKVYYEAVSNDRHALPSKIPTTPLVDLSHEQEIDSTELRTPFIIPNLKKVTFTVQTDFSQTIVISYDVKRNKPFGGKSKNTLLVYNGPDQYGSRVPQEQGSRTAITYRSNSFRAFVDIFIREAHRLVNTKIRITARGDGGTVDNLKKANIPDCHHKPYGTRGTTISSDLGQPRCLFSIENQQRKFFKIFLLLKEYTSFVENYSNQLEKQCPYAGFVILEKDLKSVLVSREYVGPFCSLLDLETTMDKMPFYVSTGHSITLLLYSFRSPISVSMIFEKTSCQGLPVLGIQNKQLVSNDTYAYDIKPNPSKRDLLNVGIKTGQCLYIMQHPFLQNGEVNVQVNGPANYELTLEAAMTSKTRWETSDKWVYTHPERPKVTVPDYGMNYEDYSYGRDDYRSRYHGMMGMWPFHSRRRSRKTTRTIYEDITEKCSDGYDGKPVKREHTNYIVYDQKLYGLQSMSTIQHKEGIATAKVRLGKSSTCSRSNVVNSFYLRAEADDCMESSHSGSKQYSSSCGFLRMIYTSQLASLQLKFPEDGYYYVVELANGFHRFCTSKVTFTIIERTNEAGTDQEGETAPTTTYEWENIHTRGVKWSSRTNFLLLMYQISTNPCPSQATTLKFQAHKYERFITDQTRLNCTIKPGLEKYHLTSHTYHVHVSSNRMTTWQSSQEYCKKAGGYLWNVETRKELETVLTVAATKPTCGNLGLIYKYGVVPLGLELDKTVNIHDY